MKGSLIVITTTFEEIIATFDYRQKHQPTYLWSPFNAYERELRGIPNISINTFAPYWMNPRDPYTFGSRATKQALGQIPSRETREPFFPETARDMVKVVDMCVVILTPWKASAGEVARIMHEDPVNYLRYAQRRIRDPILLAKIRRYTKDKIEESRAMNDVIQTACTALSAFLDPRIMASLSRSDIRFTDFTRRPMTLGIGIPLESLDAHGGVISYLFEQILAQVQSEDSPGEVPLIIACDEILAYPKIEGLVRAATTLRKYNAAMAIAATDYGGLAHIYGKQAAETLINNSVAQWMSTKDQSGTQMLSGMLGEHEVFTENISVSNPVDEHRGSSTVNRTMAKQRRRLLEPFEVAQDIGPFDQIVMNLPLKNVKSQRPILCKKLPVFKHPRLRKLARKTRYAPK